MKYRISSDGKLFLVQFKKNWWSPWKDCNYFYDLESAIENFNALESSISKFKTLDPKYRGKCIHVCYWQCT